MGIKNILIIGNGDISHSITSALTVPASTNAAARYRVTILTYPSQSLFLPSDIPAGRVEHGTCDFTPVSLERAFAGEDLVISTISGGNYELQMNIIHASVAAGIKRFIPSEFGHDILNDGVQRSIAGGDGRAKVIKYLRGQRSLEWVAVAVGCVLDPMLLTGDLGFDLEWQSATINGSGTQVFPASSLERVGLTVKSIIQIWDSIKNQFIYAASLLVCGDELVAALEQATKSKWSVGYSDVGECIREGKSRLERGFLDSGMFLLERSILYDTSLGAKESFEVRNANQTLGLEPESTLSLVSKVYHEFNSRGKPHCGCG